MKDIETAVQFMLQIAADDRHGYDQTYRQGPDYDCSSLVGTALHKGGYNISPGSTTRNLFAQLDKENFSTLSVYGARKRGDIFLTPGRHVVMCVNENQIVHASINEKGKITGGKPGDQTGKEICVRSFYAPSYGWKYHLRCPQIEGANTEKLDYAKSFNDAFKGVYSTTAPLHLRCGAGIVKKSQVIMPKGLSVTCYGFYTSVLSTPWLLVTTEIQGTPYQGFCSATYLKRTGNV